MKIWLRKGKNEIDKLENINLCQTYFIEFRKILDYITN